MYYSDETRIYHYSTYILYCFRNSLALQFALSEEPTSLCLKTDRPSQKAVIVQRFFVVISMDQYLTTALPVLILRVSAYKVRWVFTINGSQQQTSRESK